MDRRTILRYLEQSEKHVAQGAEHIARQCERIAFLTLGGHDVMLANDKLRVFEETQALHVANRDRIRAELSQTDSPD